MKQIAIKFGIIGGILITVPMLIIIPNIDSIGFDKGITILFISMIVSFISVFLGIGSVRKNVGDGYIGFRMAFATGIIITVITSVCYVIVSLLLFYVITPSFNTKYNAFIVSQMQAMHSPQADIDKFTTDAANQLSNPNIFVNAVLIFIKPLMFGMFFTFPSSLILRKKEFTPTLN
ncbi:MAG TPA: DUF4199 domain-containing protein [Bacteroidia bacterium]|nr:DUF4199 domain-containing protein [Bacteroidia bacterium]